MKKLLWIGIAGAAGAVARTVLGQLTSDESGFPYATLSVNIVGTFLLCSIIAGAFHKLNAHREVQDVITTGFLGSFTTFSALSMETVLLLENEQFMFAALYVFGSILGGLTAGAFGFRIGGRKVAG